MTENTRIDLTGDWQAVVDGPFDFIRVSCWTDRPVEMLVSTGVPTAERGAVYGGFPTFMEGELPAGSTVYARGVGAAVVWSSQLLQPVAGASTGALSGGGTGASGATPTLQRITGAYTVPSGAYTLDVVNIGAADGIFAGAALIAGESISLHPLPAGVTYAEIALDATGTEFEILEVR